MRSVIRPMSGCVNRRGELEDAIQKTETAVAEAEAPLEERQQRRDGPGAEVRRKMAEAEKDQDRAVQELQPCPTGVAAQVITSGTSYRHAQCG